MTSDSMVGNCSKGLNEGEGLMLIRELKRRKTHFMSSFEYYLSF